MQHDHELNSAIIHSLNDTKIIQKYALVDSKTGKKRQQLHFRGILRAVKELYRAVTDRLLSLHLEGLERQQIIERDKEFRNGLPRFYRLTNNTKMALKLELPIRRVQSNREENRRKKKNNSNSNNNNGSTSSNKSYNKTRKDTNENVYLLLMSLATIGFSIPEPVENESDIRPGDIYDKSRKKTYRFSTRQRGISINEFLHEYRDSANGWRFHHVTFKNTSKVKKYFKILMSFEPPIIKPINEIEWVKKEHIDRGLQWPIVCKETRYGIADKQLKEFLDYCILLLGETEMLMEHVWKYKKKPTHEQVEWYRSIYGKDYANNFFIKINEWHNKLRRIAVVGTTGRLKEKVVADARATIRQAEASDNNNNNNTNNQSQKYKSACEILDYVGGFETFNNIKKTPYIYYHQKLCSEEYDKNVRANYSYLTEMFEKLAYPEFVEDICKS
jgi:DNA-binding HxlR family transcriptional regulator